VRLSLRILLLTLAIVPSVLLGGCGGGAGDTATIRFWNGFTGPDGRTMLRMVKQFNEENPGVRVVMQRMDWYTYYNKLFVAGIGGRAPEVFILHSVNIPRFMQANFLRPVDGLLREETALSVRDFRANVWAATAHHGQHYGVPLDVHPQGMYYNKALFREAGIVDASGEARPPRTREEFMDAVRKLTRDIDGDGHIDQWGFVFTNLRNNMIALMSQFGGGFFDPGTEEVVLNSEANVRALQWARDLIHEQGLAPSPENYVAWLGFRQGNVAIAFEGVYMLGDLSKQTDLDFGAAPLPILGDVPATWADSHVICLRGDLRGEQLNAAWRFVSFISNHSLDWAEAGQIPARDSLLSTERFQAMTVQAAFAEQLDDLVYAPNVPFNGEFETEFNEAVELALRDSMSPREALDRAAANVEKAQARYRELMKEIGEREEDTE